MRSSVSPILPAGGMARSSAQLVRPLLPHFALIAQFRIPSHWVFGLPVICIHPSTGRVSASNCTVVALPCSNPDLTASFNTFLWYNCKFKSSALVHLTIKASCYTPKFGLLSEIIQSRISQRQVPQHSPRPVNSRGMR